MTVNVRRIDSTSVMTPQIADSAAGPLMPRSQYVDGPCSYRESAPAGEKEDVR